MRFTKLALKMICLAASASLTWAQTAEPLSPTAERMLALQDLATETWFPVVVMVIALGFGYALYERMCLMLGTPQVRRATATPIVADDDAVEINGASLRHGC